MGKTKNLKMKTVITTTFLATALASHPSKNLSNSNLAQVEAESWNFDIEDLFTEDLLILEFFNPKLAKWWRDDVIGFKDDVVEFWGGLFDRKSSERLNLEVDYSACKDNQNYTCSIIEGLLLEKFPVKDLFRDRRDRSSLVREGRLL